jgi:thiosulfate dehydrogenase [quinone] large subunit
VSRGIEPSAGAPAARVPETTTTAAMIAALRVGVALMWIQNVGWKVPPDFGRADDRGLYFWAGQAVDYPVFAPYSAFVESVVLPNIEIFGWFTLLIEGGLGAFLLVGLATRFWAVVGIGQTIAITLSVLFAPHEWHWSYYLMALAHLAIFATAAGRSYGIDGVLRDGWSTSTGRLPRLLTRSS